MLPRIYDGSGSPAPERITLRAGKLTITYQAGMLCYIRFGNHEIVRGIYAAVRDHNWGTIPFTLSDVVIEQHDTSFVITFTSDHVQGDIHFAWRGTIIGTNESEITFLFYGEALTSFRHNRIGFCVLHPMDMAGKALTIEHTNSETEQGEFPRLIAPRQPYFDIRAITHEVIEGVQVAILMEGNTFEMEDQRNWTDASFKTYCTPLSLPYPAQIDAGTHISQKITVRLIGNAATVDVSEPAPTLHLGTLENLLPLIGLGTATHHEPLTTRQIAQLKRLRLDHIRVEVDFDAGWEQRLLNNWNEAQALSAHLLVVARLTPNEADYQLRELQRVWTANGMTERIMPLSAGEFTTSDSTWTAARTCFDNHTLSAGTDGYFTELNRNRPPQSAEITVYSVNPQVHAFDNATLIETLPVIGETVVSARHFSDGLIWVSPVTFKIRRNPAATAPEAPTSPGQLPPQVDPRQMSLFGAGWTMGAIASVSRVGAHSLTFYETTGWLGIMELESGSPLPELFPSIPGGVFPMYHIFADAGEMHPASVRAFTSSHPLRFSGLALQNNTKRRLLVANHTHERQTVTISGISGRWAMKSLDEYSAEFAMRDPEAYRDQPGTLIAADESGWHLDLFPYAVVRLDQDCSS